MDDALGTFKTQREAIDWVKKQAHSPLVARVRHLNDKKKLDHWRSAKLVSAREVGARARARPNDPPRYIIVEDWNELHEPRAQGTNSVQLNRLISGLGWPVSDPSGGQALPSFAP